MVHSYPAIVMAAFQLPFSCSFIYQRHSNMVGLFSSYRDFYLQKSLASSPTCLCEQSGKSRIFSIHFARRKRPIFLRLQGKNPSQDDKGKDDTSEDDEEFLKRGLPHIESLEDILDELESYSEDRELDEEDDDEYFFEDWDEETLEEFFDFLPDEDEEEPETYLDLQKTQQSTFLLENALLQGVVPVGADVGSDCLPGDYGFDPLNLAEKDYFRRAQACLVNLLPVKENKYPELEETKTSELTTGTEGPRPKALILRDYREIEIRHGRLAMLAAIFWPLQELLDRLVLDEDQFNSLLNSLFFGGVTLPFFPLLMTGIMLLLGYLDIYSQAVKDMDKIGEAFLPGDCFWDPLQILAGAPDRMKRNMQERELFNGRFAMLAFAIFIWEEATTGLPLISVEGNEILFGPAYTIPFIQEWLDSRFSTASPVFYRFSEGEHLGAVTSVDFIFTAIKIVIL